MATKTSNVLDVKSSIKKWGSPSVMRFANTEIPASEIELDKKIIDRIIASHKTKKVSTGKVKV